MGSVRHFARFALVGLFALGIAVTVRGERARACGCCSPSVSELTTFDPGVLGDPALEGLDYNPYVSGFGSGCTECFTTTMFADWHGYLKDVTDADWRKILMTATSDELAHIQLRLAGKSQIAPKGYETSSIWKSTLAHAKLVAAIELVQLAREVEPEATLDQYDSNGSPKRTLLPPLALLTRAKAGLASAPDPFIAQRYAFQAMKLLFYRMDWKGAIAFFDKTPALAAPSDARSGSPDRAAPPNGGAQSIDLPWRARYYLAGALKEDRQLARANLELALVHGSYSPLAALSAKDFHPKEDGDWHDSLKLARTPHDKALLWRLVGMKLDPLVAIQEILKLDPRSNLVALLLVREMTKAELITGEAYGGPPEPEQLAAQRKELAAIEKIANQVLASNGDRPWLMELLLGHIASKRGDLATARSHLELAVKLKPNDPRVASQARASLALALVLDWKINPQREEALAAQMNGIVADFGREAAVSSEVRGKLAPVYAKAGKTVEAEFLEPSTGDAFDRIGRPTLPRDTKKWADIAFIKQMIAQLDRSTTAFEKFLLTQTTFTKQHLQHDLALRFLLNGDFATSARLFETTPTDSAPLHTDPFVTHIIDSIEDDHQKLANAKWTHATLAARLVELQRAAGGKGEPAAQAAMLLGNALYNITLNGNARIVLRDSHHATHEAHAAEHWYKRAFELSTNRELRAQAAFMAAKAELGSLFDAADQANQANPSADAVTLIPKTWYPILKGFANTRYYKEVLAECGRFRSWVSP